VNDFLFFFNSAVLVFFVSGWVRIEHRLTKIEMILLDAGINGSREKKE